MFPDSMILATTVLSFLWCSTCFAFLNARSFPARTSSFQSETKKPTPGLNLVPLLTYSDELEFFSAPEQHRCCIDSNGNFRDGDNVYEISLVEEEDLPDMCRFVVATFGADAIRISQDMNALERLLLSPGLELLNSYSSLVAFAEVFSGTKQRLTGRFEKKDISAPQLKGLSRIEMIEKIEKDSLVLVLAKRNSDRDSDVDIIGSIELRLQPCDAKIPFSLPWLDKVERRVAAIIGLGEGRGRDLQPYLSNLCVDPEFRGKKIGRALVRCVEDIAKARWGYKRMYLHVDEDNAAALNLYQSGGYRDVGHRWNPVWAGTAADIGYYVKTLQGPSEK